MGTNEMFTILAIGLLFVSPPFLLAFLALTGGVGWWGYIPIAVWLALVTIFARGQKGLGEASRAFIDGLLTWISRDAVILGSITVLVLCSLPFLLYSATAQGPHPSLARTAFMACIGVYVAIACIVIAGLADDYSNNYFLFEATLAVFGFLTPPGVVVAGLVLIWRWGAFGAWWDWLIGHFTG